MTVKIVLKIKWDNTCDYFIPRASKLIQLMKNYCHSQLVPLLPLFSVKIQKDYFHLGGDGKKEMAGIWHDSGNAA